LASGSSIIIAKLFVFLGNPVQLSGGVILTPSQVYLGGIGLPSSKAELTNLKLLAVCDFEVPAKQIAIIKRTVFKIFLVHIIFPFR
jgi:hypothetical protein